MKGVGGFRNNYSVSVSRSSALAFGDCGNNGSNKHAALGGCNAFGLTCAGDRNKRKFCTGLKTANVVGLASSGNDSCATGVTDLATALALSKNATDKFARDKRRVLAEGLIALKDGVSFSDASASLRVLDNVTNVSALATISSLAGTRMNSCVIAGGRGKCDISCIIPRPTTTSLDLLNLTNLTVHHHHGWQRA